MSELASLSDEARMVALERFEFLRPHLEEGRFLTTLAEEAGAYELVHRRQALKPNAIWQADHCVLDVLIKREDGSEAKPWLSVILDDYSRAISGYFVAFEDPCAIRTALTLRQAIWRTPHGCSGDALPHLADSD